MIKEYSLLSSADGRLGGPLIGFHALSSARLGRFALVFLCSMLLLPAQPSDLLTPPAKLPGPAPKLAPLLVEPSGQAIASQAAWLRQRAVLLTQWQDAIGHFPARKAPLETKILSTEELPDFFRQHVQYQIEEGVLTDGYLLIPKGAQGKLPAVVVFHQTTASQAKQVAGIDQSAPELMQGVQLVRRGYVVFCPRCFIFDEGGKYADHVARMQTRHPDWTGMARMTWDAVRALDFVESLPNVDSRRIGGIGHSLGAKEVLYAAAFDERYKVAVFSEGGIGLGFSNWQAGWYLGPKIREPGFRLDHHQLIALIAPRAFLLLGGESADGDRSWPYIEAARPVYTLFGAPASIGWLNHRTGHRYPPVARQTAEAFLDAHLKK